MPRFFARWQIDELKEQRFSKEERAALLTNSAIKMYTIKEIARFGLCACGFAFSYTLCWPNGNSKVVTCACLLFSIYISHSLRAINSIKQRSRVENEWRKSQTTRKYQLWISVLFYWRSKIGQINTQKYGSKIKSKHKFRVDIDLLKLINLAKPVESFEFSSFFHINIRIKAAAEEEKTIRKYVKWRTKVGTDSKH